MAPFSSFGGGCLRGGPGQPSYWWWVWFTWWAGGGINVLPLSFLPFVPEQTLSHYLSHLLYGLGQIPLIWAMFSQLRKKP